MSSVALHILSTYKYFLSHITYTLCYMQVFIKEINGAKYTVYYEFDKNYSYPVTYHVRIIKSTYKKLKNFDFRNLLDNCKLKNIIEKELYMPVI